MRHKMQTNLHIVRKRIKLSFRLWLVRPDILCAVTFILTTNLEADSVNLADADTYLEEKI